MTNTTARKNRRLTYHRETCVRHFGTNSNPATCPRCHGTGYEWPELRILTLWQPYASLMAWGDKRLETRGPLFPDYRGWVAIHAHSTKVRAVEIDTANESYTLRAMQRQGVGPADLPRGQILCVVRFTGRGASSSVRLELSPEEIEFGDYAPGRWAIYTGDLCRLATPIPWKGAQGLQVAPETLCAQIAEQIQ